MSDLYHVNTSNQGKADLRSIYDYIADVLLEPIAAERMYTKIEKAVYSLDQFPERYRRYDKEPWRSRNLRVMPVGKYLVFYVVDNATKLVTVVRIMYGGRDVDNVLSNTEWLYD